MESITGFINLAIASLPCCSLLYCAHEVLRSYGTYPPSVIRLQQASNGVLPAVTVKPDIKLAPAPTRQTARIKIESPSVTAAAKKAAAETVEDVSTDEESSTKSGDDTLVNKSSASGAGTSDAVVSPTKSKL